MNVGEKVICIDDDFSNIVNYDFTVFDELPRKGQEYIIRRREMWDGGTRLLLEEVRNPLLKDGILKGMEPGFDSKRFAKPEVQVEVISEEVEEEIEN